MRFWETTHCWTDLASSIRPHWILLPHQLRIGKHGHSPPFAAFGLRRVWQGCCTILPFAGALAACPEECIPKLVPVKAVKTWLVERVKGKEKAVA